MLLGRRGVVVTMTNGESRRIRKASDFTIGVDGRLLLLKRDGTVLDHLDPGDWQNVALAKFAWEPSP